MCLCAALIGAGWRALSRLGRWAPLFVAGLLVFVATAFNTEPLAALKHAEVRTVLAAMQAPKSPSRAKRRIPRAPERRRRRTRRHGGEIPPEPRRGRCPAGPAQRTWCQYEVDLVADDFIARALCDADRDGAVAVTRRPKARCAG